MLRFVPVVMAAALCAGCSGVQWLNPVVTEDRAATEHALTGYWANADGDRFLVRKGADARYEVVYLEKDGSAVTFDGVLTKVGDALVMDVSPRTSGVLLAPVHALVRVWVAGDTLRWSFVDSEWMKARIAERGLAGAAVGRDGWLVTAPTGAVDPVLLAAAADDRAHGEVQEMHQIR